MQILRFPDQLCSFQSQVEVDGGRSLELSNYPYIFMRWKEQYFVKNHVRGYYDENTLRLTCVSRVFMRLMMGFFVIGTPLCSSKSTQSDGSINGFYCDPNSSPFQKLELKTTNEGRSGFSFSSWGAFAPSRL
ncbi:uncharacterized protein LOC127789656 [Diospyros lotus]|uniref:uncharacterized protein LOC127789656 n=1 Tax=Diospyros lotus TaxID=55363 RepID=UPI002256D7AA|nr:uncharacterized protein LOC127789656 [Diospyros lotus]